MSGLECNSGSGFLLQCGSRKMLFCLSKPFGNSFVTPSLHNLCALDLYFCLKKKKKSCQFFFLSKGMRGKITRRKVQVVLMEKLLPCNYSKDTKSKISRVIIKSFACLICAFKWAFQMTLYIPICCKILE